MYYSILKKSFLKKSLFPLVLATALGTAGMISPAFAKGGSTAGGGKPGGGNSGGVKDVSGTLVVLSNSGVAYKGKFPQGSVTLGYAADGSAQSMSFSLSLIHVPDGSVLPVRVLIGHLETTFTYYQITEVVYTEVDGTITVSRGVASLKLSKLNGDVIPNFPGPAPAGTTEISIFSPDGATRLLDGVTGGFHV